MFQLCNNSPCIQLHNVQCNVWLVLLRRSDDVVEVILFLPKLELGLLFSDNFISNVL